jgi:hypothetical protein
VYETINTLAYREASFILYLESWDVRMSDLSRRAPVSRSEALSSNSSTDSYNKNAKD